MLGKLMKYEFKSLFKTFSIAYLLMIIASILLATTIKNVDSVLSGTAMFFFVVVIVTTFIMVLVFTITRFNKSLLSDEGYLMFTVPAKTSTIVLSKAFTIVFFSIFTTLVVLLACFCIGLFLNEGNMEGLIKVLDQVAKYMTFSLAINIIIYTLISSFSSVMLIYLALSFGQIGKLKKHKNIFSIIFYFVTAYIISMSSQMLFGNSFIENSSNTSAILLIESITKKIIFYNIYEIVLSIVFFIGTVYILDKKLNLD
ncbi:hypothetical protein [Peptostreptococcus equinus]|uniref:ABC transporter permease n=1 Tax=Peptostreptococcus equinus TaxID=3003601 RepID=A0ABY7JNC8_9FIRM|nr:hypothetical protein [Peptostreptococcus sp. CBA3647]WAW14890.1 hypothetical protein O0R46_09935 [Peptostreptococcus sp. CBA3647]